MRGRGVLVVVMAGSGMLAGAAACSFASLGYLQNGPVTDGGTGGDVVVDPDGGTLDAHVTPLATGQQSPNLLAQDTGNVYWISSQDIMTVPKAGGASHSIARVSGALELAADNDPAGSLFVVTGTTVVAVKKSDGSMTTLFGADAGGAAPTSVLADDTSVFVLQIDAADTTMSKIVRVPKSGGAGQALSTDPASPPQAFALTAADVVWSAPTGTPGAFFQLSKETPTASPVALPVIDDSITLPSRSRQIAANDATIFWTDNAYLYGRDRQAASMSNTLYNSQDDDEFPAIALDGMYLYALNGVDSSVMRVSLDGKTNARLVTNLTLPTSLVVDGTSVYVSVGPPTAGQILKIDK